MCPRWRMPSENIDGRPAPEGRVRPRRSDRVAGIRQVGDRTPGPRHRSVCAAASGRRPPKTWPGAAGSAGIERGWPCARGRPRERRGQGGRRARVRWSMAALRCRALWPWNIFAGLDHGAVILPTVTGSLAAHWGYVEVQTPTMTAAGGAPVADRAPVLVVQPCPSRRRRTRRPGAARRGPGGAAPGRRTGSRSWVGAACPSVPARYGRAAAPASPATRTHRVAGLAGAAARPDLAGTLGGQRRRDPGSSLDGPAVRPVLARPGAAPPGPRLAAPGRRVRRRLEGQAQTRDQDGRPIGNRATARSQLLIVRAFYLDIAQWAAEDPSRWAEYTAPCPVKASECSMAKERKHRKAAMDQRTRARLPALPALVRTADL